MTTTLTTSLGGASRPMSRELVSHFIDRQINAMRYPQSTGLSGERPTGSLAERLFDSSSGLKVLIHQVSMHLDIEWRDKLFRQLDSLLDVEEWDQRDPPPSALTARTFVRLLLTLLPQRKPGLAISNAGNLIVAWTEGENRLTIECQPNDELRWVLSRRIGENLERAAGTASLERLQAILSPYDPEVWFKRGE